MIYRRIKKGSTDQSLVIRIVDSGDGTPETGVTSASGGLDLQYTRIGGTVTDLTESDLAAIDTVHTDGGMKHIGNGYYRVDVPDAAFATGAAWVVLEGTVTGMIVIGCLVELADNMPGELASDAVNSTSLAATAATEIAAAVAAGGAGNYRTYP